MTKDEIIRALREAGVFPPSVTDCHYADKTEMTKAELILRSLDETGLLPLPEHDAQCGNRIRCIHFVIGELQGRLPDGDFVTCGAFRDLGVGCCDQCHTNPLHGMNLVELPGGTMAWLCCAVDAASSPEPYPIIHEREEDSPQGVCAPASITMAVGGKTNGAGHCAWCVWTLDKSLPGRSRHGSA